MITMRWILGFAFIGLFFCAEAQKPEIKFRHLTAADGLSHTFIRNILQDGDGFMWFATPNGLNKYDGYSVTVYKNIDSVKTSISNNDVWEIFEDSKKNLWVGTRQGLNRFNKELNIFIRDTTLDNVHINYIFEDSEKTLWVLADKKVYKYNKARKNFIPVVIDGLSSINVLYEDQQNTFYIGTQNGVYTYDRKQNEAKFLFPLKSVKTFYEDGEELWVASSEEGIVVYNPSSKAIKHFKKDFNDPEGLQTNGIFRMNGDSSYIYIGTENNGLILFDKERKKFYSYLNNPSNPESISFNTVTSIFVDPSETVWLATFAGVDIIKKDKFKLIRHQTGEKNSLSHNNILCFSEDSAGNLWIGTDGGGLNYFDRKNNSFICYKNDPNDPKSLSSNAVTYLKEDRKGNLWVGAWGGGLSYFDKETKEFTRYLPDPDNIQNSISSENVVHIYEDQSDNLWIGTSKGLDLFDRETGKFTHFSSGVHKFIDYINCIYEDKYRNIWIGTFRGLFKIDIETGKPELFVHDQNNKKSISSNVIYSITEDGQGNLRICTLGGVDVFNPDSQSFKSLNEKDGFITEAVLNFQEDGKGFQWMATTAGLARFDPKCKEYKLYNISDGLQDKEFKQNAYSKLSSDELVYGGPHGFNIFNPNNLPENKVIPPVVITNFSLFNKPVPIGTKDSPLKKHISHTKEIILSHKHSVFSFDFAALNYISPEKNQYAYKLVGLEKDWNYVGNKRSATYTNLDPGEYLFWVKASNNDGYWNEEGVKLKIIVTPPFWNTWWFKLLLITLILAFLFALYNIRIRIIHKQKKALEIQVKERTLQLEYQAEVLVSANEELNKQKEEIQSQAEYIERIYKDTKDSIRAAQIIQEVTLPEEDEMKRHLSDYFILNKPKDVVSGDFYWFSIQDEKILIASVDCIGHGVSGAFMSIHGHYLLKQSIYANSTLIASEILDSLNEGLIKELHQMETSRENQINMDISFCIIDKYKKKLQYAGANGVIYLIRGEELIQIKGDKFPVGLTVENTVKKYQNNEVDLVAGDVLYLFSDGFADQLGGSDNNEKYMYPRFRNILCEISQNRMSEQKVILEKELESWRGDFEQIDDILVIGIKI